MNNYESYQICKQRGHGNGTGYGVGTGPMKIEVYKGKYLGW